MSPVLETINLKNRFSLISVELLEKILEILLSWIKHLGQEIMSMMLILKKKIHIGHFQNHLETIIQAIVIILGLDSINTLSAIKKLSILHLPMALLEILLS